MLATLARLALPTWEYATRPSTGAACIAKSQERILGHLLRRLAPTAVGRQFDLARIIGARDPLEAFRHEVPVTEYADYGLLVDRAATGEADVMFPGAAVALAQTSGTTRDAQSGERYVPQGEALLRHHRRGGAAALARLVRTAGVETVAGKLLMLSGSTTMDEHGPVPAGDLSGICAARLPRWISSRYEPGPGIASIIDVDERIARTVERCADLDLRLLAGIPSWLLVMLRALCRHTGHARAGDAWPRLSSLIYGGHAVEPFIVPLAEHLDADTWMMEVYPASEAFIAVGERPWRVGDGAPPALELLTAHGVYFEFQPDGGSPETCVGAHELECGQVYRVLVTTPGGLLRYQIGDLVTGVAPGKIRFAGRVKARLSAFGEHVEGHALSEALAYAAKRARASVINYHVAPVFPSAVSPTGAHEWLIEFERPPTNRAAFAADLDAHLRERVLDYAAHRLGDVQLLAPRVRELPLGTIASFLASRGRADVQRKVPQAWPDRTIADALVGLASGRAEP